ncbi:MAG TPA: hypothetical protein VMV43_11430 [Candidatus Nanopelagicaceae bacterium]|nr:hypothetical protein [Candidatus Nanopelagicaceae bacterium]
MTEHNYSLLKAKIEDFKASGEINLNKFDELERFLIEKTITLSLFLCNLSNKHF